MDQLPASCGTEHQGNPAAVQASFDNFTEPRTMTGEADFRIMPQASRSSV
jgi:hypothetical protein